MERILRNKKGDATDSITLAMWVFVIALIILVLVFAFSNVLTPLKSTVLGEDNATLAAINSVETYITGALPSTYFVIFFGLLLGILVSSYFISVHPIFIPIYILLSIASIKVAVALGNAWGNLTEFTEFSSLIAGNSILGIMDLIVRNIVLVTLIAFILSFIIIFAKPGGGSGGNNPF